MMYSVRVSTAFLSALLIVIMPIEGSASHIGSDAYRSAVESDGDATGGSERFDQRNKALHDRVCSRIKRRFGSDEEMVERINRRLENRFGFTCTGNNQNQYDEEVSTITVLDDGAILRASANAFGFSPDSIPRGANHVPVLKFDLTASCDRDVMVESILVADYGPGASSDVLAVWMSIDGMRISTARRLAKNKMVNLRFMRTLTVPACHTLTLDLYAAFTPFALVGSKHEFSIQLPEDIHADSSVAGDYPITGNRMSITGITTGNILVQYLIPTPEVEIAGTQRQVVSKFSLTASHLEDQVLHEMIFENVGRSQDGDFVALYLRSAQGRARFTNIVGYTVNDRVVLKFDPPYPLLRNQSMDLEIVSDIVTGTGDTVQMQFEEPTDLFSVGSTTGYGINGQLYGSQVMIEGIPAKVRIR